MPYLKLLETFVLTVLMDKNEYNFFHKDFRPIKLLIILALSANVFFTFYLVSKLSRVHDVIAQHCPAILGLVVAPPTDPASTPKK